MNTKLQSIEKKRKEIYLKRNKNLLYAILFLIATVIMFVLGTQLEVTFLFILGVVLAIGAFIFFGKVNSNQVTFKKIIKKELIHTLLQEEFDDVVYEPKNKIDMVRINDVGMVRKPDRYYGEDYIKGNYKGVGFEVSDVDLKQRVERRDRNGHVHVSYETYFKGRWYIYTFKKVFKEVLKVVEGRGSYANKRGLEKLDTESIAFNKKFTILATSKKFGFYIINSRMIEKLLELEKLHRGSILYCIKNNELHVGVNDRKNYMEFKLNTPINEDTLKVFMSDIELIPAIINEFNLDSTKFNT